MGTRSVLLAGATGLVGRECLRLLLPNETFDRIVVLSRRRLEPDVRSPKLETHVFDFDQLAMHADLFEVDSIICALGTTIKQAGSQEEFRRVDYEYALTIARLGRARGARHFLLVSSLGAKAQSRVFYNRVKGELEDAVRALGYPNVTILRPSLLLGPRADFRVGEAIAKRATKLVRPLLPTKLKPVAARAVAAALVDAAATTEKRGVKILESGEIKPRSGPSRAAR